MKQIIIVGSLAVVLAACTTTSQGTANIEKAIDKACDGAEIAMAALEPWVIAGRLSEKATRLVNTANTSLFAPATGLCVAEPSGNLTAVLVRISSFALTISDALNTARKGG